MFRPQPTIVPLRETHFPGIATFWNNKVGESQRLEMCLEDPLKPLNNPLFDEYMRLPNEEFSETSLINAAYAICLSEQCGKAPDTKTLKFIKKTVDSYMTSVSSDEVITKSTHFGIPMTKKTITEVYSYPKLKATFHIVHTSEYTQPGKGTGIRAFAEEKTTVRVDILDRDYLKERIRKLKDHLDLIRCIDEEMYSVGTVTGLINICNRL